MSQPLAARETDVDGTLPGLGLALRDLDKSMRLIRQRRAGGRSAVPAGTVSLLMHIDEHAAGCHGRELAARTGLDPSTISRAVASLVANGLVERRADPADGRASVLVLTAAGTAALTDAHRWFGEVLDRALADWTAGEVGALCTALGRFVRAIEQSLGNHDTLEAAR
jgi:DNA-binding MarR family transcriptional regulator